MHLILQSFRFSYREQNRDCSINPWWSIAAIVENKKSIKKKKKIKKIKKKMKKKSKYKFGNNNKRIQN